MCKKLKYVGTGRMEGVAHAVTLSSDKPILLEAAARARPIVVLADGWKASAGVTTDSSKDVESGSCTKVLVVRCRRWDPEQGVVWD